MDEQLTISTPEQVAFHYEVAGIGSRFVASLLDHLILGVVLFLLICAASVLQLTAFIGSAVSEEEGLAGLYLILAIMTLIIFAVLWGYFVIFEMIWNGQTPGKRAGRLRVIRRDGQPIGAGEALIRNLVRLVDFLPGFYGIGLITMFIDSEARRLGDFAAGTIVVREGQQTSLRDVRVPEPAPSPYTQPAPSYPSYTDSQLSPQSSVFSTQYDPLPGISLRDVTADDYHLARELVARVRRGELGGDRGAELAARLAHGIAARMGQDFGQWQARGWQPLSFLESVIAAKDARGE